jgi:hypothetical protein
VTEVDGEHAAGHAPAAGGLCPGCKKAKATLRLVGGEEMRNLLGHVGQVLEQDTFNQAITKVEQGIKQKTNQATSCFKLFQQMPQNSKHFAEYYPKVREQAERCIWTGYDAKMAARDAILFQTDNKKLQKKIITEDLSYEDTVKAGLAMEQGEKKVEQIRRKNGNENTPRKEDERVAKLEEKIRALEVKQTKGKKPAKQNHEEETKGCQTCTRSHKGKCFGLEATCHACNKKGHFRYSPACKLSREEVNNLAENLEYAYAGDGLHLDDGESLSELSETSDSEDASVGRVVEQMKQSSNLVKHSRRSKVQVASVGQGLEVPSSKLDLVIDTGSYRTLINEDDWIMMKFHNSKLKLEESKRKFRAYGSGAELPILGRSKCQLMAASGASVVTRVYVMEGKSDSLLGLREAEALGVVAISSQGKFSRKRQQEAEVKFEPQEVTDKRKGMWDWQVVGRRKSYKRRSL